MKIPISRKVLEKIYHNSLVPFIDGLTTIILEFDELFVEIDIPEHGLELLDDLDPFLIFTLSEFIQKKSVSIEIEVIFHFNRFDFEVELIIEKADITNRVRLDYSKEFSMDDYFNLINVTGQSVISLIKEEFP
jgi:hypothetical protein